MSPTIIHRYVSEKLFDIALTSDAASLPKPWTSAPLGDLREGLLARPTLAARLGPGPVAVDRLRQVPFISPVSTSNGRFIPANDDCPLPYGERRVGHQSQTMHLALELAVRTDQLVFGPILAATAQLEAGSLVEVPVQGWDVRQPLFLACDADAVMAPDHKVIVRALREALQRLG
jgi:DNA-binding transcriptional LysR family regulator